MQAWCCKEAWHHSFKVEMLSGPWRYKFCLNTCEEQSVTDMTDRPPVLRPVRSVFGQDKGALSHFQECTE